MSAHCPWTKCWTHSNPSIALQAGEDRHCTHPHGRWTLWTLFSPGTNDWRLSESPNVQVLGPMPAPSASAQRQTPPSCCALIQHALALCGDNLQIPRKYLIWLTKGKCTGSVLLVAGFPEVETAPCASCRVARCIGCSLALLAIDECLLSTHPKREASDVIVIDT